MQAKLAFSRVLTGKDVIFSFSYAIYMIQSLININRGHPISNPGRGIFKNAPSRI